MDSPSSTGSATAIQLENLHPVRPNPPSSWHAAPLTPCPDYYLRFSPEFTAKFESLDEDSVYTKCEAALLDRSTKNFIVDFGGEPEVEHGGAWCALDLDSSNPEILDNLKNLLKQDVSFHAGDLHFKGLTCRRDRGRYALDGCRSCFITLVRARTNFGSSLAIYSLRIHRESSSTRLLLIMGSLLDTLVSSQRRLLSLLLLLPIRNLCLQ